MAVAQSSGCLQFVEDLDHVLVKASHAITLRQGTHLIRKTRVKRLGNLLRLADAAALYNDVVKLLELGDPHELLEQISSEGAADASILQCNDFLIGLCKLMGLFDERGIDIDATTDVSPLSSCFKR